MVTSQVGKPSLALTFLKMADADYVALSSYNEPPVRKVVADPAE